MKKKFLALILCMMFCFASTSMGYAYDMEDILFQAPDYYTPEYQAELKDSITAMNEYVQTKTMARSGAQKFLRIDPIRQEAYNYCGPASAQMIIKYKKSGSTLTQKNLAGSSYCNTDNLGLTTAATITQALNKALGSGTYQYIQTNQQRFSVALIYSIDKGYPVACNVDTAYLPAYNGISYGHWVVATGYSYGFVGASNDNDVRYNDPHYKDEYFGTYTIDWMDMSDAIKNNYDFYVAKSA